MIQKIQYNSSPRSIYEGGYLEKDPSWDLFSKQNIFVTKRDLTGYRVFVDFKIKSVGFTLKLSIGRARGDFGREAFLFVSSGRSMIKLFLVLDRMSGEAT